MVNSEYADIESSDAEFAFDPPFADVPSDRGTRETQSVGFTDASDESVFSAMTMLIGKDPRYKSSGNRKEVRLTDKKGVSFRMRTTEQSLRREWFDRLVKRGDAFQAKINDKGAEYDSIDDKPGQPTIGVTREIGQLQRDLDGVKLELLTLDALLFPHYRTHLVTVGYPDLQRRVARETDRSGGIIGEAANKRQQFFGEGNVPVWMNNTGIVARVVKR